MNLIEISNNKKRVVYAPRSDYSSIPASVVSVELSEDEDVEWLWTHYPNGQSIVTGYKIIKQGNSQQDRNS